MTPRLRISWMMAAVAFLALEIAAVRSASGLSHRTVELLGIGVLPMANVLAACGLVAMRRPSSRPFLLGFVAFGSATLAAYLLLTFLSPGVLYEPLGHVFRPLGTSLRATWPAVSDPIVYTIAGITLLVPQVLVAWLGGKLSTIYKVVIVRRVPRPESTADLPAGYPA